MNIEREAGSAAVLKPAADGSAASDLAPGQGGGDHVLGTALTRGPAAAEAAWAMREGGGGMVGGGMCICMLGGGQCADQCAGWGCHPSGAPPHPPQ